MHEVCSPHSISYSGLLMGTPRMKKEEEVDIRIIVKDQ